MLIQAPLTTRDACCCFLFHSTLISKKKTKQKNKQKNTHTHTHTHTKNLLVATHSMSQATNRLNLQVAGRA